MFSCFYSDYIAADVPRGAICSSVASLGFLCEDGGRQLLGVRDVGAPRHHPAHQLRGEDVAQVDVHFLPHVPVAAVHGGVRVLWHVGGGRRGV